MFFGPILFFGLIRNPHSELTTNNLPTLYKQTNKPIFLKIPKIINQPESIKKES